ncbi:hypothetical protein Tco_0118555, partial [Tanacetum coccineum]
YVPEPEYPEYLVPSDGEAPREDQPLPDDASPIALSLGYVADSDLEEDSEEDPKEDSTDYLANGGDDDDDESSDDNDDDDDVKEDEEEEEEHLALADSTALPAIDPVPLAENTEAFKTDESAATPPAPPAYHTTSRMSIPPPRTSPTYAQAPQGCRAAMMRAAPSPTPSPPLLLPSTAHKADIPEADIPPRKRLLLTAPTPRFKVGESSVVAAARQSGSTVARRVDCSFVDTVDGSIRASERRNMDAIEVVNLRVSYQADVRKRESKEFYTRH